MQLKVAFGTRLDPPLMHNCDFSPVIGTATLGSAGAEEREGAGRRRVDLFCGVMRDRQACVERKLGLLLALGLNGVFGLVFLVMLLFRHLLSRSFVFLCVIASHGL